MARPPHTRLTWSGILGPTATPVEQWSWSLNLGELVFTEQSRQDLADTMNTLWVSSVAAVHGASVVLTRCRVAQIGADGKYSTNAEGGYNSADNLTVSQGSGTASATHTPQTSLVVSLGTNRAGPTGKGRVFLPMPKYALVATDLRITATDAQGVANAMKTLIDGIELAVFPIGDGSGGKVSVVSSYGYASPVTKLRVGRALDTLRTRRRDILEGYVELAV